MHRIEPYYYAMYTLKTDQLSSEMDEAIDVYGKP